MNWKLGAAAATAGAISMGAAPPPPAAPTGHGVAPMATPAPTMKPYLGPALPDSYKILPPAPIPGTTRYETDRSIYLGTRSLKDTPRWALAQKDVDQTAILKDLSC